MTNPAQYPCLVVEDEVAIRELIGLVLEREGYPVTLCGDTHQAQQTLKNQQFAVLIVDWMLPGLSGVEWIRSLRQQGVKSAILMLTAKALPDDVVQGLDAGADDYLTKPFDPAILKARVRALVRRVDSLKLNHLEELELGFIKLNIPRHEVSIRGEPVHLTPSEFKILQEMMLNPGRVLTRDYFISRVQGEGIAVTGRTIDTHVFALRKKLGDQAEWIETIRGVGYRVKTEWGSSSRSSDDHVVT